MAPGYKYSSAFLAMANWTGNPDGIASFVAAPAMTIPGNRMGVFQGIAERDEQDLLAYLATQKYGAGNAELSGLPQAFVCVGDDRNCDLGGHAELRT